MNLRLLTVFITVMLITSCKDKKNYGSVEAVVTGTKHKHWGAGYYNLEVYYKYFNGKDSVNGHLTARGKEHSYTARYVKGDSLRIGFDTSESADTFIVEKTYVKPRMK